MCIPDRGSSPYAWGRNGQGSATAKTGLGKTVLKYGNRRRSLAPATPLTRVLKIPVQQPTSRVESIGDVLVCILRASVCRHFFLPN